MDSTVRVWWIPLGAGGHVVRWNGRLYEAAVARHQRRARQALYHAALEIVRADTSYTVEMAPAWARIAADRGVVCTGPVGLSRLGRSVLFRYEVRLWRDGTIPDRSHAVGGPTCLESDPARTRALLDAVRRTPPLTWGRDELGLGEMWNSNALVSRALAVSRHDLGRVTPPPGGRAPGWRAGLELARLETVAHG